MTNRTRLSLFEGFIFLALAAAITVVYLNWSYAKVTADRSEVTLQTYGVGAEYAGIIDKQFVKVGDTVTKGQPLFRLKSDTLTQQLKSGSITPGSLTYPVSEDGALVITASKPGTIQEVKYVQGAFVPANQEIAIVADTASVGVTADFTFGRHEQANLSPNTPVTVQLPTGSKVSGRIMQITRSTKDGENITTVQAALPGPADSATVVSGAPAKTTLLLNSNTIYDQLVRYTGSLLDRWI